MPAKQLLARNVIKGGAIIQLAIIVTMRDLGFRAACLTSLKQIFTTVRYIMNNKRMPIGLITAQILVNP